MEKRDALERLHALERERVRLSRVSAVLQWDQETYLPPAGVSERAEQLAMIEGLVHERATEGEIGRLLERLGSTTKQPRGDESLPAVERDFLRVARRDYDLETKLPSQLVTDAARAEGLSQAAWAEARKKNDFESFAPHLRKMIEYSRLKAEYWGLADRPYDALLNLHEPDMKEGEVAEVFAPLKAGLSALVKRISSASAPDTSFLNRDYPRTQQDGFCRQLMEDLGLPAEKGRLDLSAHPFTTSLGPADVRITTRYFPRNMLSGLFSVIHETGHALYDLGFSDDSAGDILAEGASSGIHESQSRLWENVIGRSRAFWRGRYGALRGAFPSQLAGVDEDTFYRAVNVVRPSFIRVDADEVTYSLHVILRFELERRLFAGTLEVEELPSAWRELMGELLGTVPETDADGVLQDIHWSMGAFGYFPSYALGNLFGLQFWSSLKRDLPDVDDRIAAGEFRPILDWLRSHVHVWGKRLEPAELLKTVTGQKLSAQPFLDYLEEKYSAIYGL